MPLANYTTSVSAERSIAEIQADLVAHGATAVAITYDQNHAGKAVGITWKVDTAHGNLPFTLPIDVEAIQKVLAGQGVRGVRVGYYHCHRVGWRIVRDWVRAQMAIIETEMVDLEQVFLPYLYLGADQTLYDHMMGEGQLGLKALASGK